MPSTALIWEHLAISINQAKNNSKIILQQRRSSDQKHGGSGNLLTNLDPNDLLDGLEMIPDYFANDLTNEYMLNVNAYLKKAFSSPFHPLENLLKSLCDCFTTTYVSNDFKNI